MLTKELDGRYKGEVIVSSYKTSFYYDVRMVWQEDSMLMKLVRKPFDKVMNFNFEAILLEDHLERPKLFGVLDKNMLIGFIELHYEPWNNRERVSTIWVDEFYRRKGIGKALITGGIDYARKIKARELVLDIQSCNDPAISFYLKTGFRFNGIDLSSYSNTDVEDRGVRIEMAYKLQQY